jgi:DivIVA domain-containing protein
MGSLVLVLVIALVVGALIFGVLALLSGDDPGLVPAEPDHAVPLPANRPLLEADLAEVRFDTAVRGYRMAQVDQALRRAAYDVGYKDEMIAVLEAELSALREGRTEDAELMRKSRETALAGVDNGYTVPVEAGGEPVDAEADVLAVGADDEPAETELADAAVVEAEDAQRGPGPDGDVDADGHGDAAAAADAEAAGGAEADAAGADGTGADEGAQPVGQRSTGG